MLSEETVRRRVREKLALQRTVVQALLELREQLPGSLFARYAECGKESCLCRQGQKHGPYYVLSSRSGGQGAFTYLDSERAREARDLVDRHREFRAGLRKLRKLNQELVALLRRYQLAQARRGGRRLGLFIVAKTTV